MTIPNSWFPKIVPKVNIDHVQDINFELFIIDDMKIDINDYRKWFNDKCKKLEIPDERRSSILKMCYDLGISPFESFAFSNPIEDLVSVQPITRPVHDFFTLRYKIGSDDDIKS